MSLVRSPKFLLGLASLTLVLFLFAMDFKSTSPGPLSPVHAAVAALAEESGCDACHGGWFSSMTSSCLECHEDIGGQVEKGGGLHGAFMVERVGASERGRCGTCHLEHHGGEVALVGPATFGVLGFESRDAFDHRHTEYALGGKHARLACAECHARADADLLEEGQTRFTGLQQDCQACHDDPHEGRFARSCDSCHGQEQPFGSVASFVHVESFPLVGGHARATCERCHEKESPYAIEAEAGHAAPPPARQCADCHDSVHRADFLVQAGALAAVAPEASCAACHDAERAAFQGDAAGMPRALHAAAGFALQPPHADVECAQCHSGAPFARAPRALAEPAVGADADFRGRFPGRAQDDCAACHADPHEGQFDDEILRGDGCLACHARDTFVVPEFTVAEHARTSFPLEGSHASVSCNECHVAAPAAGGAPDAQPAAQALGARIFRGTPQACAACHEDSHRVGLDGAFADANARARQGCDACHVSTLFSEVDRQDFDHAVWTGFDLHGAHARAGCEACHAQMPVAEPDGRRFGRSAELFEGPFDRCSGCHVDAHRNFFADRDVARASCADCHSEETFRIDPIGAFDHGRETGFALDGAHAAATCERCHGPGRVVEGRGAQARRSFGFLRERVTDAGSRFECANCHEDPHRGRYGEASAGGGAVVTRCEQCHDTHDFSDVDRAGFDHAAVTGYALSGQHAGAECSACHISGLAPAEGSVRLPRTRGDRCSDCHEDPHAGQFVRAGGTDCAQCHRSQEAFEQVTFDHQKDARFALDSRHVDLACSACHVPWPLKSGQKVVRYKPLGTECIDCHDHGGKQGKGRSSGGTKGGGHDEENR